MMPGFVETPYEIANLMVQLSSVDKRGAVLDSGSGRGVFLQALINNGFTNIYGIEINNALYKECCLKFIDRTTLIHGDFLTYEFRKKFDLIIGNPPYVHFNQLPGSIATRVSEIIKTREGDIYYAFIIRAISLLREGGELIYIVPYHFFYNTYARFVRDTILKNGKIEIIIDLDETHLFDNASPETVIFKFKKGFFRIEQEKIKVLRIKRRNAEPCYIAVMAIEAMDKQTSNELFDYNEINHYRDSNPWSSYVMHIPEFPYMQLGEIARVGVGLVSGFDKAFLLSENEINHFPPEEQKLIKKFVKGKHCKRFVVEGNSWYILIDESIKSEDELADRYPHIYSRLLRYKGEMMNRYLPDGGSWYQWQALRNYSFLTSNMNNPRIYVPVLDRHNHNRFSIGDGNLLPSGDVVFIHPYREKDVFFLLGYMNSSFFRNYYMAKGGRRGGRISFTQKLLENTQIPIFNDTTYSKICEMSIELVHKKRKMQDTNKIEKELDYLIENAINSLQFKKIAPKLLF